MPTPEKRAARIIDNYCKCNPTKRTKDERNFPLDMGLCLDCLAGEIRAAENDALDEALRITVQQSCGISCRLPMVELALRALKSNPSR